MADRFHHTMHSLHPKLKFEIGKPETTPNGLSLSLLDFKVTISEDGRSSFKFYKKPAKKPLFVHHQSAIPKKSKINFIRNGQKRIEDRSSTQTTSIKHQNMFDNILRINGYSEDKANKAPTKPSKKLSTSQRGLVLPQDSIHLRPSKPQDH